MLMETNFQSLLQGELFTAIQMRVAKAFSEQFPDNNPLHARAVVRALGEAGIISDLATHAATDVPTQLLYVHIAETLATFKSAAATDLFFYQLQCIYPLLHQLGDKSALAKSLAIKLVRGELEFGRLLLSLLSSTNAAQSIDLHPTSNGYIVNGPLPVCLAGVDTDFYPLLIDNGNDSLDVFIVPANAESVHVISRAPVAVDEQYFLANLELRNLELGSDYRVGSIDKSFYQQHFANYQSTIAVANNQLGKTSLDSVIDFLRNRLSNGVPMLKLDVVQHRIAALHAELVMSKALACAALGAQQQDGFIALANASSILARNLLEKISAEALHFGGINHYRTDSELARIYQEACWNNFLGETMRLSAHS